MVYGINWSVVCSADKLQHVHKALAYRRLNVTPYAVHSTLQSYYKIFVLFLFSEVAQLHNMLKRDYILYWRDWVSASFLTFSLTVRQ